VADSSLVLDANILVRAVLGVRVRGLLERYGRDVEFTAPDVAFKEVNIADRPCAWRFDVDDRTRPDPGGPRDPRLPRQALGDAAAR
jgi:hypothetical protein